MSDVIGEQVEAPAVEPVVEAEQSGEDPLLAAIDEGFSEMDRLAAVRDGTTEAEAEPESSEDAGVDWAELQRLDAESGQTAWRAEQQEQRSEVEAFQQWQSQEQVAAAEQAYEERRDAMFGDVLSRLDDAYAMEDGASIIHLADEVAQNGDPAMLGSYLAEWDRIDPVSARQYEASFRARAAEAEQAGFQEGQRLAQLQEAAWQDQFVQDWLANDQQQRAQNAQAMSDEVNRLTKTDPAFGKLADTVVSIAEPMFREWQGELTPEVAAQLVQSSYENAVSLQAAQANAPYLVGLDEVLHNQELMADRTGTVGRFDPERAKFLATTELLQSSPLGEVSRARQRALAGDTPGHPDAYDMLGAFDEQLAREEASRQSQAESTAAFERARKDAEQAKKR